MTRDTLDKRKICGREEVCWDQVRMGGWVRCQETMLIDYAFRGRGSECEWGPCGGVPGGASGGGGGW